MYGYGTRTPGNQAAYASVGFKVTFAENYVLSQQFLVLNSETVIALSLLRDLDAAITCACPSYEEFLNTRNVRVGRQFQSVVHGAMVKELPKRWRLGLARFIRGHSFYALLYDLRRTGLLTATALPWFGKEEAMEANLLGVIEAALPRIRDQFSVDFMQHKNLKHMCCGDLCSEAIGWDGNHKCRFMICDGPDGYTQSCEALGTVVRCCNKRPLRGYRQCARHLERARSLLRGRSMQLQVPLSNDLSAELSAQVEQLKIVYVSTSLFPPPPPISPNSTIERATGARHRLPKRQGRRATRRAAIRRAAIRKTKRQIATKQNLTALC